MKNFMTNMSKEKTIEWQKNEQLKALEGQHPQVRRHAIEKKLHT